MKTIIGIISCAAVAVSVAACHHDNNPPPATPAADNTSTTTTTTSSSYQQQQPSYVQTPPQESASSTYSAEGTNGAATGGMETYGADEKNKEPVVRPSPATPKPAPLNPSLTNNEPGTSPKPVAGVGPTEPGPVNAKAPDKKSPNAAAATDQGNSKPEVQISSRIRKTMMASKTLSFGAKNAKVITQGTKVTLRGNVKSDAEKNEITGIARNTDGVTEVDDQLVVKP